MLKPITESRPDDAPARMETYPGQRQATADADEPVSLDAVVAPQTPTSDENALLDYSKGFLSRQEAIRRLRLRDYAGLLLALGDADLSMPLPPADEIQAQAQMFVKLWNMG